LDKQTPGNSRATSPPDIRQAGVSPRARKDAGEIAALAETVRHAQRGDETAQHTLITNYQRRIAGFIYTIVNNSHHVEDIAQIVFIKMIRALPRLDRPEQFEAWLFRLARNACIDHIRRERWQKFLAPLETEDRVLEIPDKNTGVNAEELDALHHAINKLKPKDRALIALAQEGRGQEEMADITGITVAALKARLHRAREQLKHHYENASRN
jgi:RNA polymerase sigma-70 factor (ECF subfamily)